MYLSAGEVIVLRTIGKIIATVRTVEVTKEFTMKRLVAIFSAGAVALMLSSGAQAADPVVTAAQIEAAKTPADHEAIAAAFDQEAARLEALANDHEKMAHTYRSMSSKKGMASASMHAHCAKLAKRYQEAAQENRELAKEHRAMKDHAGHQQ
jgi:hypothetical protein